jgi:O-antigen/teichoic acid export membrane protein
MEDVRKALAVSIGSRGFGAVLGLAALPLYVRLLGIEAYGVVGLFASLQVLVAFLDFGLAATLTRELAAAGRDRERLANGRDVARTFELAYALVAVLIGILLAAVAGPVASHWVNLEGLTAEEVRRALVLAGAALACQWPVSLYGAGLAGLHLQTPLAVSSSLFATVRVSLSLAALWHSPTLDSFFLAQIASALLQTGVTRAQMWRGLALAGHRPAPGMALLLRTRSFAGGMTAITITSILLVQMDKVILSYLLRLPDFGVYVVASSLATGLYVLISPVFSVVYPRLSALWGAGDVAGATGFYHASSQAMAALVLPLAVVMACFPAQALFVLTGDPVLSREGAWVLTFLVAGSALNGLMNVPYALQLASGWTSLSVWINAGAIAVLAPATWFCAQRWGAAGGAAAWAALNLGYLALTPHLLHRRLIPREKWLWYLQDVLVPAAASLSAVLLLLRAMEGATGSRWLAALQLAGVWLVAAVATVLVLGAARREIARVIWR